MTEFDLIAGAMLKEERIRRGMTQKEVAQKIHKDTSLVSYIENGKRSMDLQLFHQICRALELDPSAIFVKMSHQADIEEMKRSKQ